MEKHIQDEIRNLRGEYFASQERTAEMTEQRQMAAVYEELLRREEIRERVAELMRAAGGE